jgi:hypothetical protein
MQDNNNLYIKVEDIGKEKRCKTCNAILTWKDYYVSGKAFLDMNLCSKCLIAGLKNILAYEEEKERWQEELHRYDKH